MKDSDDEDMSGDDSYEEVCTIINKKLSTFFCLNQFNSVANLFQNNVTPNVHSTHLAMLGDLDLRNVFWQFNVKLHSHLV